MRAYTFCIHVFSLLSVKKAESSFETNSPYSSVVECQSCKLKVCSSILHEGICILYLCVFSIVDQGGRVPVELPRSRVRF